MENKKGFTLIEMLIVITIIAVLASLILVGMGGAQARSRDSRRIADLHNVMNALELYNSFYGSYPTTPSSSKNDWDNFMKRFVEDDALGISRVPSDPLKSSNDYFYRYVSNDLGTDYVLGAKLEQQNAVLEEGFVAPSFASTIGCGKTEKIYCIRP